MPFTPFHFGPGILLGALAPRRVSIWAFCAANVVIDVEPGALLLLNRFPIHRFMHTIPGALTAIGVTVTLFWIWSKIPAAWRTRSRLFPPRIPLAQALIGAALGAGTHILFDGVMHDDMSPFWPLTSANPLLGRVNLGALHLGCVIAGFVGGFAAFLRRRRPGET